MYFAKTQLKRIRIVRRTLYQWRSYPNRELNFYFMSTGRCGTRFFAQVLNTATNAMVLHQPHPYLRSERFDAATRYMTHKDDFKQLEVTDYPVLLEKILWQATLPSPIYGDTLNSSFAFGYMLYKYFGSQKLRLVHLVRNPVDCCRSILKVERDEGGQGFGWSRPGAFTQGNNSAEKVANVWINTNEMIRYQFELIHDPTICKIVRLEDVNLDLIRELFDFLHLKGFDPSKVEPLLTDTSREVRHSHLQENPQTPDATPEELDIVAHLTAPLAAVYNYALLPKQNSSIG